MQWARRRIGTAGLLGLGMLVMLGAAPATSSYQQILGGIEEARGRLAAGQQSPENVENWNTFFGAVEQVLRAQAEAETAQERREHLERLGRMRDALATRNWGPSNRIAASLGEWLEPRLAVARTLEALEQSVAQMPGEVLDDDQPQEGEDGEQPRDRQSVLKTKWTTYVDRLNAAIRDYESARTVGERINAARKLRGGLASLRWTQANYPWGPAGQLSGALHSMLDLPNVQVTADPNILSPFLSQQIVNPEIIFFRGQTSYVQPGYRTGFGLMHSNDGIAFYNSQWSHSTTPVSDFQQQVAQEGGAQGRMATNMYYFGATIYNNNHVTATAILTPDGLVVYPENAPQVSAAFGLMPQAGLMPGVMRAVASLVGFGQGRVLSEVQQQAMPQIQAETASGTAELAAIKTAEETARQNAMIQQYLVGNRTLRFQDFALTQLSLSSAPWAAYVSGVLQWAYEAGPQIGADFPKPAEFAQPEAGLTLDVHLNSTLTNLAAGLYQTDEVKQVENLLVKLIPPQRGDDADDVIEDAAEAIEGVESIDEAADAIEEAADTIEDAIEVIPNASYEDLLQAIGDVQSQTDDPNAIALRISKPSEPPAFAVDAQGRLVAFLRNITIEVPAPENFGQQRGLFGLGATSPRTLRFILEEVELTVAASFTPEDGGRSLRVQGEIASITYGGSGTTVVTVGLEEDQTQQLNLLNRSGALGVLAGRIQGQDVDVNVPLDMLQGFLVAQVSDMHPSGWMRVVLQNDPWQPAPQLTASGAAPAAPAVPAPAMATQPAAPVAQPALTPTGYVVSQ